MKHFALPLVVAVAACSSASKDIAALDVPAAEYAGYSCERIGNEQARIQRRVLALGGKLDQAAADDKGIAIAGAVLFWPALFFLGGTREQEAEYARLKGEYNALQTVAMEKKCSAPIDAPAAPAK